MEHLRIQPVLATALPEVARFLHRQVRDMNEGSAVPANVHGDASNIELRLRWLLLESPLANDSLPHGFCIRDDSGTIRGLTLGFPTAFLAGDQRLLGRCCGSLFVEPQAQTMGFYLFKKEVSLPGRSLVFCTSCNANSAKLWQLEGCAVPNSDLEYIFPLRLDALVPALMAERTGSGAAAAMARMLGWCANPILQLLGRHSAHLTIEPCRDWEKLSELSRRHRTKDFITGDRTPEFLEWRYGRSSDPHPAGVYLFRDKRGNEGWFSLGNAIRGRQGQVQGAVLLDAVWPLDKMSFREIFPGILQMVDGNADVLSLLPRAASDYGQGSRWLIRRRRAAPNAFVVNRGGNARYTAAVLDLVCADGDSALPFAPVLHSAATETTLSQSPVGGLTNDCPAQANPA